MFDHRLGNPGWQYRSSQCTQYFPISGVEPPSMNATKGGACVVLQYNNHSPNEGELSLTCAPLRARLTKLPGSLAYTSVSIFHPFGRCRYLTGALILGKEKMCICNKTVYEWNWINLMNHDWRFGVSSLKKKKKKACHGISIFILLYF